MRTPLFTQFIYKNGLDQKLNLSDDHLFSIQENERSFLNPNSTAYKRKCNLENICYLLDYIKNESEYIRITSNYKNIDKEIYTRKKLENGLHVFRVIFSYYASNLRSHTSVFSDKYHSLGYIQINNILEKYLRQVADLSISRVEKYSVNKQSFNQPIPDGHLLMIYDLIKLYVCNAAGLQKPERAERLFYENIFLQRIENKPDDNDIQKVFHSDIFFPAVKFWYFPNDVEEGAFEYVPYSTDLVEKPEIINWHYEQSLNAFNSNYEDWRSDGHREGSLRIDEHEIEKLGLTPKKMKVKANTLIIANVFGFHRRGDVTETTYRDAIHGSIRIPYPMQTL